MADGKRNLPSTSNDKCVKRQSTEPCHLMAPVDYSLINNLISEEVRRQLQELVEEQHFLRRDEVEATVSEVLYTQFQPHKAEMSSTNDTLPTSFDAVAESSADSTCDKKEKRKPFFEELILSSPVNSQESCKPSSTESTTSATANDTPSFEVLYEDSSASSSCHSGNVLKFDPETMKLNRSCSVINREFQRLFNRIDEMEATIEHYYYQIGIGKKRTPPEIKTAILEDSESDSDDYAYEKKRGAHRCRSQSVKSYFAKTKVPQDIAVSPITMKPATNELDPEAWANLENDMDRIQESIDEKFMHALNTDESSQRKRLLAIYAEAKKRSEEKSKQKKCRSQLKNK